MNPTPTLNLLRERFGKLTESAPNLFRGERWHADKQLGVYYFDFSQQILETQFDLEAFTQKQIAPDFYTHEGSLQWNYYLYFVVDSKGFEEIRKTPRASEIETNKTFARKFIREQTGLNEELAKPLAATLATTHQARDIASRWVEELKAAGLGRIPDPSAEYTSTVSAYLLDSTVPKAISTSRPTQEVEDGRFIQMLQLDRFRTHPEQKNFEFGTVNLIRGVNGTGKTSVLEAVELCICGGNRRQNGERPDGAKLQIQYNGQPKAVKCPESSAALYRSRDLAWYGGYYRQGNQLCHNFARFNFFDSDAAYQLSSAATGKDILDSINSLLLGEFATTIEERMKQFLERFNKEQRDLKRLVQIQEQEAAKVTQQIKLLKEVKDTREALLKEMQAKAENCGWRKLPARFRLEDLAVTNENVDEVTNQLSQHVGRLPWFSRVTISSMTLEGKRLSEALKDVSQKKELAAKNITALDKIKAHIAEGEAELKILQRLNEYHEKPNALTLIGINEAIKALKVKVAEMKEAVTLLNTIDLKKFDQCAGTLDEVSLQFEDETARLRRNLTKLKSRASALQTQLGTLKTVIEEIKGLGRRFCEIHPDGTDCPLCGAHYEHLSAQIASTAFSSPTEASLRELTTEIAREQQKLTERQKNIDAFSGLRQAAQIVFAAEELATRQTKAVAESLASLGDKLVQEKGRLDELVANQKNLKLAGFEEDDLQDILDSAQQEYSISRSKLSNRQAVQKLVADKTEALNGLRNDTRNKDKARQEIDAEISRAVKKAVGDVSDDDGIVELERRKLLLEEILDEANTLQKSVTISDTEDFSSLEKKLEIFSKALARIQQGLKSVEEKDAFEQRFAASLDETQKQLAKLKPKLKRAEAAVNVLDRLLGSDYKAAYLQHVLGEHKSKIATIFTRIHAPFEFKDVHIDTDVLLERGSGTKSPVSEISTGQRAALALSIFLSLNSSVHTRAPWLLFDDPVVHVDDLNILSFLDMLRDLVLLGNKQVFFATANTRIADLFAKKFDFLGTEFKEFRFQR
jgi:DNA repair exonuclease SbcCD ATPase subunit